jgi:Protein of unknown function (DUF1236)
MRRTWIGAAAAAGITTFAATGLALAQEKQDQQRPETQHMEKARTPAQIEKAQPGAGQAERQTGKEAQEQKAPQAGPNAVKDKAQTGQAMQPENRQGEKAQTGQAAAPEKAQTGQAMQPENRQGEKAQTGQPASPEKAQTGQAAAPETRQLQSGQVNATAARPGGNAAAVGKVQISSASATRISEALISTAPATSQNINVAVNIGAPLPGEVELLPLPPAVVSLVPEYQGYEYVVVNEQVAIVQPSTRVVVEVITPTGVAAAPAAPPPAVVNLTDAQQQLLVESVQDEGLPQAQIPELADGQTVPQSVELTPVPSAVVARVPMIERYRIAVANNRVVLVDPGTRVVVHVVR